MLANLNIVTVGILDKKHDPSVVLRDLDGDLVAGCYQVAMDLASVMYDKGQIS